MKIILAHNNWRVIGGAEFFYQEVGRVLKNNGHEVAFFSARDDSVLEDPSTSYFPRVVDYSSGSLVARAFSMPKMIYNQDAKQSFAQLIREFKPDIIHAFAVYIRLTPSILDAAREAGIPVVMSCNDYKHICPNYKLFHHGKICMDCRGGKFYMPILNKCCHNSFVYGLASSIEAYTHAMMNIYKKNVHTFLFASEFMARTTEEFWGKDSFRWRRLDNPFNAKSFDISEISEDYILYFGRLVDEKGVNILLDAMALLPHITLKIIGEGIELHNLEEQALHLGLKNVEFLGPKWGEQLNQILARSKFVVVPSIWHENVGYVTLQAFAFGKPVIGSNRGGIPEFIANNERGLIYDAMDPVSLSQNISKLWNNSEELERLGLNAKKYVDENFNDEFFYKNLMDIYSEIVS